MYTAILPVSSDRQRVKLRTQYAQTRITLRIKERKLNWTKVVGIAAPIVGALLFVVAYGVVGSMDYNDELIIANAVKEHRHQIICSAAVDSSIQRHYGITVKQIKAEGCKNLVL